MKRFIWISLFLISICIVWTGSRPCIGAEQFPTKAIELWVGYGAGGSTDIPARALADAASKVLGQPIIIVNKPGGGSAVMMGELKLKKADGYTLGVLSSGGVLSAHLRKVPYHPVNDFDPILQYSVYQYGLVVRADSPWKTLKDLIAYAQANPNKVKYSTAGAGTPQHLVTIQLGDAAKVKWTHIPFGSGNEAVTALLGGHVDFCPQTTEWKPHVDSGRLRLLAILMDKRMESYPNVPTLVELGYNIVAPSIIGIIGPKGLPKDQVKILHDAFFKGLQDPGFKNSLKQFDLPVVYRNPEDCGKFLKELYESTGKLIEKVEKK
ncbi:MAG: tripartite tricarboxylate transporter substrate binding protein [Thermodesulfobacteriota bacterium]